MEDKNEIIWFTVACMGGLHMRVASSLMSFMERFWDEEIVIWNRREQKAKVDSINALCLLGIRQGEEVGIWKTKGLSEEDITVLKYGFTHGEGSGRIWSMDLEKEWEIETGSFAEAGKDFTEER